MKSHPFKWQAVHILSLWAVVVVQPLFDTVASNGEFLVAHQPAAADLFAVVVLLMFVVPVVVIGVGWLARRVHVRLHNAVVSGAIAGLIALQALQILKRAATWPPVLTIAAAVAVGALAAALYWRAAIVRSSLSVLGVAIVVVPAVFLFQGSVRQFWWPRGAPPPPAAPASLTTPIVLVVFDQLPLVSLLDADGGIDARLYPSFANLARRSTWYRNATAVGDRTDHALPAILTGKYPRPDTLPQTSDHAQNLFTWLAGYEHHVSEPITALCPPGVCRRSLASGAGRIRGIVLDLAAVYPHIVAPEGLRRRLPPVDQHWRDFEGPRWLRLWSERSGSDRRAEFLQFVQEIEPGSARPTLHFKHALLPHEPYIYYPSGRVYARPNEAIFGLTSDERWTSDPWPAALNYQRELQQVGMIDGLVSALIDRLERTGLYDSALLVITADHGASFRAGGFFKMPDDRNYGQVMSVPLFIKAPGQREGVVDDRPVETIDILPTIADLLDAQLPWRTHGASALGQPRSDRKRIYYNDAKLLHSFPPEQVRQARDEAVRLKLELFGSPVNPDSVVGLGLAPRVLGRAVDSLPRSREVRFAVWLDPRVGEAAESAGATFLPGAVAGFAAASEPLHGRPQLAVAVNGIVRAVTRVHYPSSGSGAWAVLLPEHAVEQRPARVEVFEILDGGSDQLALRETGVDVDLARYAREGFTPTTTSNARRPRIP